MEFAVGLRLLEVSCATLAHRGDGLRLAGRVLDAHRKISSSDLCITSVMGSRPYASTDRQSSSNEDAKGGADPLQAARGEDDR
jgi:hypothetical protein